MSGNDQSFPGDCAKPVGKVAYTAISEQQKLEAVTHLTDDVLAALTKAFFEIVKHEQWGKRDIAQISGLNETGIGHVLAGRRKNLTIETIALLARAMRKRPELVLHDLRPQGNRSSTIQMSPSDANSAATALQEQQVHQPRAAILRLWHGNMGSHGGQRAYIGELEALP
jgi:hypothetical protein